MDSLSLVFSMMVLLAVCWTLGSIVADKVISDEKKDIKQNPLIILLVGVIVLILVCLLCKL